jgi:hypothetical protein
LFLNLEGDRIGIWRWGLTTAISNSHPRFDFIEDLSRSSDHPLSSGEEAKLSP